MASSRSRLAETLITLSKICENDTLFRHFYLSPFWDATDFPRGKSKILLPKAQKFPQKILVEFSSPNIAKPFHIGHLCSTLIGQFLSDVLRSVGHRVVTLNWLGDWGTQFGLLARGVQKFAPKQFWDSECDGEKLDILRDVYVRANQEADKNPNFRTEAKAIFAQMEEDLSTENGVRNSEDFEFWRLAKSISEREFVKVYRRLSVHFDNWQCESMYGRKDDQSALLDKFMLNGAAAVQPDDGRVVLVEDGQSKTEIILTKADGSTVYLIRDVAAAIDRCETYSPDCMLYVVDVQQSDHFLNLKRSLSALGRQEVADKIRHISFSRFQGVSTRTGQSVSADSLLSAGVEEALKMVKSSPTLKIDPSEFDFVAEQLALSAIRVHFLGRRRNARTERTFCWQEALNMKNGTGFYLQATHARLRNLLVTNEKEFPNWREEAELEIEKNGSSSFLFDFSQNDGKVVDLVEHLQRMAGDLRHSCATLEPSVLVQSMLHLCSSVGKAVSCSRVKGSQREKAIRLLHVFSVSRQILSQHIRLFSLTPLDRL